MKVQKTNFNNHGGTMAKFYHIKTYGCQMNVHESEKIAGILENLGYKETTNDQDADIIVFNTCCIRETAEDKISAHIGELKSLKIRKPNVVIAVCGCMTQQEGKAMSLKMKFPFIDIILGTTNLHLLPQKIEENKSHKNTIDTTMLPTMYELPSYRTSKPNGWVNIIYGCNNFCTYCIVPYVRGREHSRPMSDIIYEVKSLVEDGYKEITLLGQNVNSYGNDLHDKDVNFAILLNELSKIDGKFRLRFMTSHPKDFSDEVIDAIAKNDKICKSIHLPVQSGSDDVLKRMNRHYTRTDYLTLIEKIKEKIPNVGISTDVMVGFPEETEQDFLDTLDLVQKSKFMSMFSFVYSPRRNTPAYSFPQVPKTIKTDRIKRLISTQNAITKEISKQFEGKTFEILVDGINDAYANTFCGRTDCGKLVNFKTEQDLTGQFINVKIKKSQSATLWGEIVE